MWGDYYPKTLIYHLQKYTAYCLNAVHSNSLDASRGIPEIVMLRLNNWSTKYYQNMRNVGVKTNRIMSPCLEEPPYKSIEPSRQLDLPSTFPDKGNTRRDLISSNDHIDCTQPPCYRTRAAQCRAVNPFNISIRFLYTNFNIISRNTVLRGLYCFQGYMATF